jgi:hypothetical protein
VQPGISKEDAPWGVWVRPQPKQRENGLVASVARPGGNVTGIVIIGAELDGSVSNLSFSSSMQWVKAAMAVKAL